MARGKRVTYGKLSAQHLVSVLSHWWAKRGERTVLTVLYASPLANAHWPFPT